MFREGHGAEDVGRAAAGGDAYERVLGSEARGGEIAGAFFGGVFGVLAGEAERVLQPCCGQPAEPRHRSTPQARNCIAGDSSVASVLH